MIVPHMWMHNTLTESFYEQPETRLLSIAKDHYHRRPTTSFYSSWAASLHMVLCYAWSLPPEWNAHVAVMDTHNLSTEVLVWHCPDIIKYGDHEFLAYGRIHGAGYRAVSVRNLIAGGLFDLIPTLKNIPRRPNTQLEFGGIYRLRAFSSNAPPQDPTEDQYRTAGSLAHAFKPLFAPVYIALLSLEPRPWFTDSTSGVCSDETFLAGLERVLERQECEVDLGELRENEWLKERNAMTRRFPDVRQWIGVMRALVWGCGPVVSRVRSKQDWK